MQQGIPIFQALLIFFFPQGGGIFLCPVQKMFLISLTGYFYPGAAPGLAAQPGFQQFRIVRQLVYQDLPGNILAVIIILTDKKIYDFTAFFIDGLFEPEKFLAGNQTPADPQYQEQIFAFTGYLNNDI